ncbi:uncharacterized protein LOC106096152 [Stomoxys calcitrans]|uniref:Uncharacterized protein n=1 Tax=Stomoxys calcitrans TaxID=35570 RepID=A0A1I8Q2J5_STOCA|nr:uncharacterized protein LOC106096152 [Stomoxys calcitrans]
MLSFIVLLQLLTSFNRLSALEMPLELLHEGLNNIPKSMDYPRPIVYPTQNEASVEMPPNVEEEFDVTTKGSGGEETDYSDEESNARMGIPKWMDQHGVHQHHPEHFNYHHGAIQQSQHKHAKHHHTHKAVHATPVSSAPLRRCSIEVSSKIPGICQALGSIGNACVSGDYIDVFNAECL